MGRMLHFSVPSVRAQEIIQKLRENDWISKDHKIHPSIDGNILIPLYFQLETNRLELDSLVGLVGGEILTKEPILNSRNKSWKEIFEDEVGGQGLLELDERWAKGHEIIGELLIQPSQKFQDLTPPYVDALIRAKMEAHPRIRTALFDYGVKGEFRVRDLEIAAVRTNKIIQGTSLSSLSSDLMNTKTTVRESGLTIHLDPSKVYYSAKLESERLETVDILNRFKNELNHPLSICDPYCGVGPALVHILACEGLSSSILANDLNPDCIPFLFENLPPLKGHNPETFPNQTNNLHHLTSNILIGNLDALLIPKIESQQDSWDVLLLNLPHLSLDHLPSLIPLLKTNSPSLVRGWSIVPHDEVEKLAFRLLEISDGRSTLDNIKIKVRKQYGPTHDMVGYWMRLSGAPTGI